MFNNLDSPYIYGYGVPVSVLVLLGILGHDVGKNRSFSLSVALTVLYVLMNIFMYYFVQVQGSIPFIGPMMDRNQSMAIMIGVFITFLVIWIAVLLFNAYLNPKVKKRNNKDKKK